MKQKLKRLLLNSYQGRFLHLTFQRSRTLISSFFYFSLGELARLLLPLKTKEAIVLSRSQSFLARLLRNSITPGFMSVDAQNLKTDEIDQMIGSYWSGSSGTKWAKAKFQETKTLYNFDFNQVSLKDTYKLLFDRLRAIKLEAEASTDHLRVLEIGCSNGRLLGFFKETKNIEVHGIDFNREAIDQAKTYFPVEHLKFQHGDALEYVRASQEPFDYVFLSAVGMYITPPNFLALLEQLSKNKVKTLLVFETIGAHFQTNSPELAEFDGHLRGQMTYSHNYPEVLKQAGFEIKATQYAPIWLDSTGGNSKVRDDVVAILVEGKNTNYENPNNAPEVAQRLPVLNDSLETRF